MERYLNLNAIVYLLSFIANLGLSTSEVQVWFPSFHSGNCGAGPRELGGWSGTNNAHCLGFGSLADAQGRYVS